MCVIQKISPDQLFKIPGFHLTLQELERRDRFHMDERFLLIIEPAVKKLQPVHKTSRIISEISLAEAEFMVIDSGAQRFSVDTVRGNILQCIFNDADKRFFLLYISVLRDHGEDRLIYTVVIGTHNVLSYPRIQERFLERRARSAQERVIQDLECQIQFFIQRGADHLIVRKISIIGNIFIACYGIFLYDLFHFRKRLLIPDLGIHLDLIEIGKIFFIQPSQLLFHIHISVEINITVGRMIIFPVEIKELLIGKLRDHLRITSGLICIRSIREERIQDHAVEHALG